MSHRRSHKKSRLGCQDCKRRHIKCDETRPICTNCSVVNRTCVYQSPSIHTTQSPSTRSTCQAPATSDRTTTSPVATTPSAHSSTSSSFQPSIASPAIPIISPPQYDALSPALNMHHMKLFSHFLLNTVPSLSESKPPDHELVRSAVSAAVSAPYLMHQLLAFSALHLSATGEDKPEYYRHEATALQTHAISLFKDTLIENVHDKCVPMLIFASFLGLHALAEAVIATESDIDGFLDRFITYLNLHRGVRIVTGKSWELLMQSNISTILSRATHSLDAARSQRQERTTIVVDQLHNLLDQSDMGIDSKIACRDAVSHLQTIYRSELSAEHVSREEQQPIGLIWAWPVLLSGVFTNLLMKRSPEALIILCYYAVLLHWRRRIWLVRNAGQMLIEAITKSLGTYWKPWLEWPRQMLEEPS